jgi:hypothetical protein
MARLLALTLLGLLIDDPEFVLVQDLPARAMISGTVEDAIHGAPIADAKVVLSCACLDAPLGATTDERGRYSFGDLPPGHYMIRVRTGRADVSKATKLAMSVGFRADFAIDPEDDEARIIVVDTDRIPASPAYRKMLMDAAKYTPVRRFTAVVDLAPTATRCD